ncbi:MAG: OPT/YSL family transporter [Rhizobiales bacterium]|nr:OPT/YSL family transporter [Hyphomicrobiales bacterium]
MTDAVNKARERTAPAGRQPPPTDVAAAVPGQRHPSVFEPATLALIVLLSLFGAAIGLQLVVTLGVTPNTSLIGVLAAMALARLPLGLFRRYRSIHVQNLAQSATAAATFGAANCLLVPMGVPFLLGRPDLVLPMFAGAFLAMLLDAYLLYRMFDSRVFPATGAWPLGVAVAETIKAGDEGGRKVVLMGIGFAVGLAGAFFRIPMAAFGFAFLGNIWALSMFGIGLLLRGYSGTLADFAPFAAIVPRGDLMAAYVPHGVLIGASLVVIFEIARVLLKPAAAAVESSGATSDAELRRSLGFGTVCYLAIAALIAAIGGMMSEMSPGMLILFVLYAPFAAYVHELIVGLAAMHSGYFPAFAVALVTLIIGIMIGFPVPALALLAGFSVATGPAFADMGFNLKAGHILRGGGADPAFEREGRLQQLIAGMFGFVIAGIMVLVTHQMFFGQNLVPPVDKVYAATILAGVTPGVAWQLFFWAIPGAILQLAGGPKRQIGVLFATGLLIASPLAGWAVAVAITVRLIWRRLRGPDSESDMQVFAAGAIAGDVLFSLFDAVIKSVRR